MIDNKLMKEIKIGNVYRFYTSRTWRRKAAEIKMRDNNECQHCKRKGEFNIAECVHHIKELRDFPELALENDNLISLCSKCHNIIHEKFKNKQTERKRYKNKEMW